MLDEKNVFQPLSLPLKPWRFQRCLRVVVNGLRLLGIPMDPSSIRSPIFRYWSLNFGWTMFAANVSVNILVIYLPLWKHLNSNNIEMTTTLWNFIINQINITVASMAGHIGLLAWTAPNWSKVVSTLNQIELMNIFTLNDYNKFRHIFIKNLILFASFVALILVTALMMHLFPFGDADLNPVQFFFFIYYFASFCLLSALGLLISIMLRIIRSQNDADLDRWRQFYNLISDLVEHVNQCFGFYLLFQVVCYFVFITSGTFLALTNLREYGLGFGILRVILATSVALLGFVYTLYIPNQIQREAFQLAKRLRNFHSNERRLVELAHQMEVEVIGLQFSPLYITALDIFHVNLSLIPKLIDTCITYVIILFQFKASEN